MVAAGRGVELAAGVQIARQARIAGRHPLAKTVVAVVLNDRSGVVHPGRALCPGRRPDQSGTGADSTHGRHFSAELPKRAINPSANEPRQFK